MKQSCNILIVNEIASVRRTVINTLKAEAGNAIIHEASNDKQAIKLLKQLSKIDYIFTDLEFDNGSGSQFITAAKRLPSASEAVYVVISARKDREALLEAAAAGATDFLLRPFTSSTLILKFRKLIGVQQRSSERVSLFEAYPARIIFKQAAYDTRIRDISLGGCNVRSPLLSKGGSIYDTCQIVISNEALGDILIDAQLVRLERDLENPEQTTVLAAFQFSSTSTDAVERLARLIKSARNTSVH